MRVFEDLLQGVWDGRSNWKQRGKNGSVDIVLELGLVAFSENN